MDPETRAYLDEMRQELAHEFEAVNQRFEAIDQRFEGIGRRFEAMDRKIDDRFDTLDRKIDATAAETRRHFDVVAESQRHDIRGLAEGIVAVSERLDRAESGIRSDMESHFRGLEAVLRVAFAEVRRDIAGTRGRRQPRRRP